MNVWKTLSICVDSREVDYPAHEVWGWEGFSYSYTLQNIQSKLTTSIYNYAD